MIGAVAVAQGCPEAAPRELTETGAGIGALTGLVGVGGGFVIVPALVVRLSFGMREAMATSMAIVGALAGPRLAAGVSTRLLGRSFAVLVVLVAIGVAAATIAGVGV